MTTKYIWKTTPSFAIERHAVYSIDTPESNHSFATSTIFGGKKVWGYTNIVYAFRVLDQRIKDAELQAEIILLNAKKHRATLNHSMEKFASKGD